jgi:hypothetical protein
MRHRRSAIADFTLPVELHTYPIPYQHKVRSAELMNLHPTGVGVHLLHVTYSGDLPAMMDGEGENLKLELNLLAMHNREDFGPR